MWHPLVGATAWLGDRLVAGSVQAAVVVALAWAACRWIPRVPAALQAWVWWLVALKLALTFIPLPALPLPLLPAADLGAIPEAAVAAPDNVGASPGFADVHLAETSRKPEAGSRKPTTWVDVLTTIAWLLGIAVHVAMLVRAAAGVH